MVSERYSRFFVCQSCTCLCPLQLHVNFSCVPRLRASCQPCGQLCLAELVGGCLFVSLNLTFGSVLMEDTRPLCLTVYRPFTDIFLPDLPTAPSANLVAKPAADSG
jgi:hypothetical protein